MDILTDYANKCFKVPKAFLFGKYHGLSFQSALYYAIYKDLSVYDTSGFKCLSLDANLVKKEVLEELQKFDLIRIENNAIYFNSIEVDESIINGINDIENNKMQINHNIFSEMKDKKRTEMIKEAFFKNENIPQRLADTLRTFSATVEEAEHLFGIILKAKKRVESEIDIPIWLDNNERLQEDISNVIARCMRKNNVANKDGYIYSAIYQCIRKYCYDNY